MKNIKQKNQIYQFNRFYICLYICLMYILADIKLICKKSRLIENIGKIISIKTKEKEK